LLSFVRPTTSSQAGYNESALVSAAKEPNPVKSTPKSLARAKRWWTMDYEMCHGKSGDGKGDIAREMKLTIVDFANPDTLKDRTDSEIFYVIKNGHNDMPAEGERVKTDETWDMVNYILAFAQKEAGRRRKDAVVSFRA